MCNIINQHPCFNDAAHFRWGRVHLPVAPKCNLRCNYCSRGINNSTENRPGICKKVLSTKEAIELLQNTLREKLFPIKVVAIAGPGEPLFNHETFEVMKILKEDFPHLIRCIATNGILLADKIELLTSLDVNTITVTICAIDPKIGKWIYDYISIDGKIYSGEEGAAVLIEKQIQGLKAAVTNGISVKVNTVLIPEINTDHIIDVARLCKLIGVEIMNIMPLIPIGRFKNMRRPTKDELTYIRDICSSYIRQFRFCKQCRADACGIPGGKDGILGSTCF